MNNIKNKSGLLVVVREPVPIHAEGFFVMDVDDSVSQVAVFEYLDEGGYYGSWLGVGRHT